MTYFYTYKTTLNGSNKFYVGRHTTKNLDKQYYGSGKWVRSIKDKSNLKVEILNFFEDESQLIIGEQLLINENINHPDCMNFNNKSVGFASGNLNHNTRPENKIKLRERVSGSLNPMFGKTHTEESKQKIRNSRLNKPLSDNIKEKISKGVSKARTGLKISNDGRSKLSQSRKTQYKLGNLLLPSFKGLIHSENTRHKMKISALKKENIKCEHCGNSFKPHTFKRWHGEYCREAN